MEVGHNGGHPIIALLQSTQYSLLMCTESFSKLPVPLSPEAALLKNLLS